MRIAVLGRTKWLYDSIPELTRAGHAVVLIGTCPAERFYTVSELDFERIAREMAVPFICDVNLGKDRYLRQIRDARPDVGVSANWLTIIPQVVLDLFPHGILNAHPGDLPRYRGNAAPNWAILQGETRIGIAIHRMVPELDAGPVYVKDYFPISESTYIRQVYAYLEERIPALFVQAVDEIARGIARPINQDTTGIPPLRGLPRTPVDHLIDWTQSAELLCRLVRASSEPFSGAYTYRSGRKLTVWRARTEEATLSLLGTPGQIVERRPASGEVSVLCGKGLLILEEVQPDGSPRCKPAETIRSVRDRLGLDIAGALSELLPRLETLGGRPPSKTP